MNLVGGRLGQVGNRAEGSGNPRDILLDAVAKQRILLRLVLVALPDIARDLLVVAGHRLVRVVGNARFQRLQVEHADQAVAAFDVMVEEGERQALAVTFDPQRDLAQVDGERILVDGVDAVADDIADGLAIVGRARLGLAGAHARQLTADAARGGEQEMAGARGRVADFQRQKRALLLVALSAFARRPR